MYQQSPSRRRRSQVVTMYEQASSRRRTPYSQGALMSSLSRVDAAARLSGVSFAPPDAISQGAVMSSLSRVDAAARLSGVSFAPPDAV